MKFLKAAPMLDMQCSRPLWVTFGRSSVETVMQSFGLSSHSLHLQSQHLIVLGIRCLRHINSVQDGCLQRELDDMSDCLSKCSRLLLCSV
jgi:hypothetical protein